MPLLRFPPDRIVGVLDWVGAYSDTRGPTLAQGDVQAPDDQEIHLDVQYSGLPTPAGGGWTMSGSAEPVDLGFLRGLPATSINHLSLHSVLPETFDAVVHLGPGLRHLTLVRSDLDDAALTVIAQLHGLASLQTFGNRFTDAGVQRLAALSQLQHLYLEEETLTVAAFTFAARLPRLVHLGLQDVPISTEELEALQAAMPNVRVG